MFFLEFNYDHLTIILQTNYLVGLRNNRHILNSTLMLETKILSSQLEIPIFFTKK